MYFCTARRLYETQECLEESITFCQESDYNDVRLAYSRVSDYNDVIEAYCRVS